MENTIAAITDVEFVSFTFNAVLLLGTGLAIFFTKKIETAGPRLLAKSKRRMSHHRNASTLSAFTSRAHS